MVLHAFSYLFKVCFTPRCNMELFKGKSQYFKGNRYLSLLRAHVLSSLMHHLRLREAEMVLKYFIGSRMKLFLALIKFENILYFF